MVLEPTAVGSVNDGLRFLLELAVLASELAIFGAGVAALLVVERTRLAVMFAAVVAIHLVLTFALDQR